MKHGLLVAPFVVFAVLAGNILAIIAYILRPTTILSLVNTWGNFPFGLFTAIFTPDTTIFVGAQSLSDWYLTTAGSLLAFLVMFVVVNVNLGEAELSQRSKFYGVGIIPISVISNLVSLLRGLSTAGPSTAIFAGLGIVVGFSLANSAVWLWAGHPIVKGRSNAIALSFSLAIGLVFTSATVLLPSLFFNIAPKVDWLSHVICFTLGAIVILAWTSLRRRKLSLLPEQPLPSA